MKRNSSRYTTAAGRLFTILGACLALAACGGGGDGGDGGDQSAGIGGTGIAVGKITDFGSIFVNGRKYDTSGSSFIVDGDPNGTQSDLEIGMVVRLKVETSNGELTSRATEVVYDDAVQGPVNGILPACPCPGAAQRSFTIFGQKITIDATKTVFKSTSFSAIDDDHIVEVSGFVNAMGGITATYVETKGLLMAGSQVEVHGIVANYNAGPPQTFEINGFDVTTDPSTEIDVPGGVLQNDLFVEVEGTIVNTTTLEILADEVEFEDEGFGNEVDEVSLQGIVSNYVSNADFVISGIAIDASGAQFSPAGLVLAEGLEIEVEGDFVGGVLIADEVELREGESKVEARVQAGSVNASIGVFEIYYQGLGGTVVVRTDAQTLFEDEADVLPLEEMSIGDLAADDFVSIEGQEIGGELVATIVKRIDDEGEFSLEGAVDAFVFASWIEILGIRFNTDNDIETEYEDGTLTAAQFFGQLGARPNGGIGTLVEIEDDAVTYGVADEVEFDD